jgi:hypothetical protein
LAIATSAAKKTGVVPRDAEGSWPDGRRKAFLILREQKFAALSFSKQGSDEFMDNSRGGSIDKIMTVQNV